jgi:hypothetical protein
MIYAAKVVTSCSILTVIVRAVDGDAAAHAVRDFLDAHRMYAAVVGEVRPAQQVDIEQSWVDLR